MKLINVLFFPVILAAAAFADTEPVAVLKKIVAAGKLKSLYSKNELSFQFNAKLPDKTISRNWTWDIKSDKAYLEGELQTDRSVFVNDSYWLLFPIKVLNDPTGTTLKLEKGVSSPLAKITCNELTVTHIGDKGATPGDVYKLYINGDFQIIEWAYLRAGVSPPRMVTTWEDYQTIDGINFSHTRKSEGDFKVWFSNISVK